MKILLNVFLICCCMFPAYGDQIVLNKISLDSINESGSKYRVDSNREVYINGKLIKRIEIGKNTLSVSFFNKTLGTIKPDMRIKLYNAYGMLIDIVRINWIVDTIESKATYTDNKSFNLTNYKMTYKYSNLHVNDDFNVVAFIVITSSII